MTITSFHQHRGCCGAFCLEAHILIFIAFDDLPSSYTFRRKISRNDVNTDKNSSALTRMIQTSPIRHSAGDMQGLHVLLRSMVMKDGIFFSSQFIHLQLQRFKQSRHHVTFRAWSFCHDEILSMLH